MDPDRCYADMLHDFNLYEYETAREHALALRQWLDRGGFYPRYTPRPEVDAWLAHVLHKTRNFGRE